MCGIFGHIVSPNAQVPLEKQDLQLMEKRLRRRGPDAQKYLRKENAIFFHSRLSFFDLSEKSNQPVQTEKGRHIIAFNGEIYNYREILNKFNLPDKGSDTLMLAQLLEANISIAEILSEVDGMFAISIYDLKTKKLHLMRDRFGEKPLYYKFNQNSMSFCSDALVLVKLFNLGFKRASAINFLKYGFFPPNSEIYQDLKTVEPGTVITLELGAKPEIIKYLSDNNVCEVEQIDELNISKKLETILLSSVESRLQSDIGLGIFLSGGVDSAIIAAAATKLGIKLPAFSIDVEGTNSEKENIQEISRNLGLSVNYLNVNADAFSENFYSLVENFDVPFCDTSAVLHSILSKHVRQYVKGVLSGDGGDEILWGYPQIQVLRKIRSFSVFPLTSNLMKKQFTGTKLYKLTASTTCEQLDRYYDSARGLIHGDNFQLSIPKHINNTDLINYMPMNCLKKVDNASMAYGLEVRAPFLSNAFHDFNLSLQSYRNQKFLNGKQLQRSILKKWLGSDPTYPGKKGFSFKVAAKEHMEKELSYKLITRLVNRLEITDSITRVFTRHSEISERFQWRLYCLESFLTAHGIEIR